MGDPRFPRRKYRSPLHPWEAERIETESELEKKYGLKNKREIWKAKAFLEQFRRQSMNLTARIRTGDPQAEKERDWLLAKLRRIGLAHETAQLTDILSLQVDSVLNRRLQTLVYHKGLVSSPDQARQVIVHGHIAIKGQRVTLPGYLVPLEAEHHIAYYPYSPLASDLHPVRPKARRPEEGAEEVVP
ncbi:MAG: 30S ribosomal protein S4 [Thermoplasmata archaeon]|nr:30S ribosomal protein S4 [Thermoplasmata archaeon]